MWGMALFLCAETMLFGGLISSYFYLRLRASHWPPAGVADPPVLQPAILTAVLVASTVPVALASRRAREGELRGTIAMIALATVLQCGYLGYQLHQLVAELHILHPQASAYASAYVALVGFHHAHVLVGILLGLGLLVWLAVSGLSEYRVTGVRAFALYWYVVNLIALAVLFTEISPSI
jgi:cytochrome c oxidase subunit 3